MEATNIKVSVILPVYNGEKHLRQAIDSVLAQTFQDFEFIIVDDGSTDSTPQIIESYMGRVLGIILDTNRGVAEAINEGLDFASGKYVAFISHDDFWEPHKLATEVDAFEKSWPTVGVVYSNYYVIKDGVKTVRPVYVRKNFSKKLALKACVVNIGSALIRRSYLNHLKVRDGFICDKNFETVMDWDLWIRISQLCNFEHIPEFLSYYRIHGEQISQGAKHISQRWSLFSRWNGFNLNYFLNKVVRAHFRRLAPQKVLWMLRQMKRMVVT